MVSEVRKTLVGFHDDHDRLWLIHTPDFVGAITEYNEELTGFDPRLAELSDAFRYSGNVYYILGTLAKERGWKVEAFEDRQ